MNLSILARTHEEFFDNNNKLFDSDLEQLETFSGKAAGVCYMKDSYFGTTVSDNDKAKSRFDRISQTGHHSIADHTFISVLFEDIPKVTAMVLNSIGFYNTSEKSGRYTVMNCKDNSEFKKNYELYEKWNSIFNTLIKEYDSNIDDKLREKLSLENARYMLSVFAPSTTMVYTTSLRMWSYIRQWCERYIIAWNLSSLDLVKSEFNLKLLECIKELYDCLSQSFMYSDKLIDNKGNNFKFLAKQTNYNIWQTEECYSDCYMIQYKSSFADLAQQQRHRTLDYFMCFDGTGIIKYYVPKILRGTEYEKEWTEDLESVSNTFPIATLVDVVETGTITNFMLKCDERLCGRVQLETMDTVRMNLYKFERQWHKSPFMQQQLEKHFRDGKVVMKCGNINCKEPCYWGPVKAQERLI